MNETLSEHLAYLSEPGRHAAYTAAIAHELKPGDLVADLGCGFGVLGLLCLEAGAAHVWGIDRTDAIDIAAESLARQGHADRYTCIQETTFRAELPEKVDLLICDHVGCFGVDYGIVAMMDDARRRFLKPGGRVIPQILELKIAGIASSRVRDILRAWEDGSVPQAYSWLSALAVNSKTYIDLTPDELATAPVSLGKVDLTTDSPELLSFTATLSADADGALDGLGGWFACELAPGATMTNAPDAADRIKRLQVLLGFEVPLKVSKGDSIEVAIKIRHDDAIISWAARNPRTGQHLRQSTFASLPMSAQRRAKAPEGPLTLGKTDKARAALFALVDGSRTASEVEAEMLRTHADLFPSQAELVRFVRAELARCPR